MTDEGCMIALASLIVRNESKEVRDYLLEAVEKAEEMSMEALQAMVDIAEQWETRLYLIKYFLLVKEGRYPDGDFS